MGRGAPFGVYVHFPYCTTRCPYCDFAIHVRRRIPHERYASAVVEELRSRTALYPDRVAQTLYFGGGTPGLWRPAALSTVVSAVRMHYRLVDEAEITVELNPGETDLAHLVALRKSGVNRLSIGAQSFDDRSLKVLGRTHDAKAARNVVRLAREAGFDNVSLDLIFGLPSQGRSALERELDALLSLEVQHLSLYGLTIEPRTAFFALVRDRVLVMPDDERQAELYEHARDRLHAAGYLQHEISSWARPGHHARHNSLYWAQAEYLGVGSSASSLRLVSTQRGTEGQRFSNHRSVDRYFASTSDAGEPQVDFDARVAAHETLNAEALEKEALWLSLRLIAGLSRKHHQQRFGRDPLAAFAAPIERLRTAGLLLIGDDSIRLTPRGVLLADRVGQELL